MPPASLPQAAALLGPLFLLAFAAGGLRVAARRARDPRRRRALQFAWVALILAGGPLWLFVAATVGIL